MLHMRLVAVVKTFAGIGSRQTPPAILSIMTSIAARLAEMGWTCRAGGADGADLAFEIGAGDAVELYLPSPGFNSRGAHLAGLPRPRHGLEHPTLVAHKIAAVHHPAWRSLTTYVRDLHARNTHQLLGADCATPAKFVICWTPDGACAEKPPTSATGGTGQAIRLAIAFGVSVFNLHDPAVVERMERFMVNVSA